MANENLSGVPPTVSLSGLDPGAGGGFSGATQGGLSGVQGGGSPFGMEGGPDLLSLLLQQAAGGEAEAGIGTGGDILQSLMQGSLGQQQGGLSAGSVGQGGQSYAAGQTGGGATGAMAAGTGSVDPLAIAQKILGLAQKGAGLLPTVGTASPTIGGTGTPETSFSDQLRTASAVQQATSPYGTIGPDGLPIPGTQAQPTIGPDGIPTSGFGEIAPASFTQQYGQAGNLLTPDQQGIQTLLESGYTPDQIQELYAGLEQVGTGGSTPVASPTQGGALTTGTGGGYTSGTPGSPGVNLGGAAQGGIGSLLGVLNAIQGIQGGNIGQGIGGGLQTIGGLSTLLQNVPELASMLGISGGGGLAATGNVAGGLGGLLGLATGIQGLVEGQGGPGTALQLGSGGLATLNALQGLGALPGTGFSGLIATQFPALANALVGAAGTGTGAAGGAAGAATAAQVASALGGAAAGAAPIIAALVSYFGAEEERKARESGWANNPIAGGLYSNATAGVQQSNQLLDRIGLSRLGEVPTETLTGALPYAINSLLPYYATAQGPKGAIKPSDAIFGMFGREGLGGADQYTQNFTNARTGVANVVQELMNRGMTYEQLGQIPGVSGNWALQSLNAGGTPDEYLGRAPQFTQEGQGLFSRFGLANYDPYRGAFGADTSWQSDYGPNGLNTPEGQANMLLQQALGGSMAAPADVSKASGLYTSMYGGPLWAALARMGAPEFQGQIQQHFDPWVQARTWPSTQWAPAGVAGSQYSAQDIQNYAAARNLSEEEALRQLGVGA